jgi:hypothetical protein
MAVVFEPVVLPSSLKGVPNGHLSSADLVPTFFPGYGWSSLVPTARRCWDALVVLVKADTGKDLSVTPGGAYRSYDAQVSLFNQRMTTNVLLAAVPFVTRTWKGKKYYLRRGVSPCATPGTSNHGYGLALDASVWNGVKHVSVTTYPKVWESFTKWAPLCGFSWEGARPGQKGWEPWHVRAVKGDVVPVKVLEVEAFLAGQKL